MKLPLQHYLGLAGIIALGAALRFWHLDFKPLWMDEVITALFSSGGSYQDVPLEEVFPLSALNQIFTLRPEVTCSQIAQTVSTQSVHPPLFFCLMHRWLSWINPTTHDLVWQLRALPALIGVGAIAALYCLNRVAFSPAAGLMGAAVMAVSPFAVYLSQEARHYTLPMLLITLSLLGLIQIQQDCQRQHFRPVVWLGWMAINSLGLYTHYFFILAFIAQVLTLIGFIYQQRHTLPRRYWGGVCLAVIGVGLSYLPWLPTLIGHFSRPETDWLRRAPTSWLDNLSPLSQTLAGWLVMVIIFPVEEQPLWVTIPAALLMVLFTGWLMWHVARGLGRLWHSPADHLATLTLTSFTLWVLLEFFAIVYILDKDLTIAPRYNFTYYPSICALLGASLVIPFQKLRRSHNKYLISPLQIQASVLLVGIFSCLFVGSDLAFQKPFNPQQVAKDMSLDSTHPLIVAVGYNTFQDVALGLSYALAVRKYYPVRATLTQKDHFKSASSAYFAFFPQSTSGIVQQNAPGIVEQIPNDGIWQNLAKIQQPLDYPLNLWVIAPGLEQEDYPLNLLLPSQQPLDNKRQTGCTLDPNQYHHLRVPYQLYRCAL
jgi:uncharacterized membrane protein